CVYFFFQAEDGIRDYKVTGVQTCALPISGERRRRRRIEAQSRIPDIVWNAIVLRAGPRSAGVIYADVVPLPSHRITRSYYGDVRSEERRVGKECRGWWSRYASQKDIDK